MKHAAAPAVRTLFAVVATLVSAIGNAEPRADVMRLLNVSGFDALLRVDASRDEKLMDLSPSILPPTLRTETARAVDQSMSYAGMRAAMADALSTRLDPAAVDRQVRWWATPSGGAVAAAQVAAFQELTEIKMAGKAPGASAQKVTGESFAIPLQKLAQTSTRTRECLLLSIGFRRICGNAGEGPAVGMAEVLAAQFSKLSAADAAAYRAYLNTPGARETAGFLADAYLRTRAAKYADAQRAIDGALEKFARDSLRGKQKTEEMFQSVVALIDDGESLDEANLMLHLLRILTPRDPRVFVELARVSIMLGDLQLDAAPGQPRRVDSGYLEDAQSWMDRAIAIDPNRADTLVLAGHLAYLKLDFDESISLLEKARRIGTNNPWLAINMADALWASALGKRGDRALMSRAARELASVQDKKLDGRMRSHVNHSLAHLYSELHEVEKGRAHFERWIAETGGCNRCALEEYAQFLFFTADDLDGAVATVRQSRKLGEPGEADSFLYAQVLLAKAAKLYENKQLAEATRVVKEVQLAVPGIERDYARLAYLPKSLPGIFALKDAGLVRDFSGSVGGLALVYASRHASAADVERLIRERANPNYFSPEEGAPLSTALMGRNLPALKVLLAHGADMSVRNRQGQLPLEWAQMVLRPSDPRDAEILATVRAAAKDLPGAEPVEGPLKSGYVYEARKKISEYQGFGHDMEAGTRLTFHDYCNYTNPDVTCLRFRHPTIGFARIDIALQKVQLVSWQEWFKEIGPAPAQGK